MPGDSGASIFVSAAEKQGTKDQYKIRNRYVNETVLTGNLSVKNEFHWGIRRKCITEIFINIELGLPGC